jgi:hypothetical protein
MSKILQALERHNRMPDEVASDFFTHSLSKVGAANEAAQREAKNLSAQLAQMTTERDRLLLEVQRFAAVNTELGELREKCRTLESTVKQTNAAILLEQGTSKRISGKADEAMVSSNLRVDALRAELATERERGAALKGQLTALKNIPPPKAPPVVSAPIQQASIGNIVRGPDGIQNAQIKLVKVN